MKMAANTTSAVVSQPTTAVVVTAGDTAVSEDRFDPFLPAVEEVSLQQSMDVNKESLKRRLMLRRSVAELADQGIYPPLKTPPAFAEQRKQLEMAKTGDLLRKKLTSRPDRQCLVQHHILEDTNPLVDSCVQERQRQLKRCRLQENLSDHLVHRPGPLDLVSANILKLDPEEYGVDAGMVDDDFDLWSSLDEVTSGYFPDENYEGNHSSPTSLVAGMTDFVPLYGHDDVFSPVSSTAPAGLSTISAPSAHVTECRQEIPIPPDISPLLRSYHMSSTDEQPTSRVPTPPDITPLLRGALSSANIQLPLPSAQPSSAASTAATSRLSSSSRSNVSKKSRPKIGTKSKVIKFHQYLGPKNLQQQLEPCASSSTATADTPFNILLQQHQMLLRWQLEFQQKNMQFLLSMPSNDPPKPAPSQLAVPAPAVQPTYVNVAVKASVTAVDPVLGAKRSRLEEMKVSELREECRRLNLTRSGSKPVLVDRLLPYADDILNENRAAAASESKPLERFEASPSSASAVPAFSISNNDVMTDPTIMFNMQQPARMMAADSSAVSFVSCKTSAVPMDVDSAPCKQEPKTPDIAQPNVYPMMILPASNNGHVVQASVSSSVPPLIVFHPTAQQPMMRPVHAPKQFPIMPPSLQEQILLEQQRHINELEHHLQLSQQELIRAQQEAQLQQVLHGSTSSWPNHAALNGSAMSAAMSSVDSRAQELTTRPLIRTNSLLDTSSSGAFDNKLRRTMTSPYISSTADVAVGSSDKSLPSFAFTVPVHESLPSVRNRTIDDVLDVLISSGDLPASAVDVYPAPGSQVTTTVVSCCPMYFFPNVAGVRTTSAVLPGGSIISTAASKQLPAGGVSDSMEWYSSDSSRPPRMVPDGRRIDTLDPTELVDFGGLLPKPTTGSDLASIDMSDWLDDMLQPGCGMSGDFLNLTDDCDLCSPADGVRASFEKLMEVTTSKS